MKDNSRTIYMVIAGILLVAGLYYLFSPDERYDWYSHDYNSIGEEPYDADLLVRYLEELRGKSGLERLDGEFKENIDALIERDAPVNYIIYGNSPSFDTEDAELIEEFLTQGNALFLLCGPLHNKVETALMGYTTNYNEWEEPMYEGFEMNEGLDITSNHILVDFTHPDLKQSPPLRFANRVRSEEQDYLWQLMSEELREEGNVAILGTANEGINFLKMEYEEGELYALSTPKLLSNYYLTRSEGKTYADGVFAHLDERTVVWDDRLWNNGNSDFSSDKYKQGQGGLTFILSREPLRYAFYTVLLGVLLFFILGAQRRQRAIPVIKAKSNSSLEYVDTITELYYSQGGHGRIFSYLSEEFKRFVRERYRHPVRWETQEDLEQFSKTTGVAISELEALRYLQSQGSYEPNVNPTMLKSYYEGMSRFFTQAK